MQPATLDLLRSGRINRGPFALLFFSSIFGFMLIFATAFPPVMTAFEWAVMLFILGVFSLGQIFLALMRCRDIGRPGWFLLAWFIPVIGMFWVLGELLLRPSKRPI